LDRRIQRTRLALHRALISLMVEKGYEAVTVRDVIDRADVGRSTFYAHYLGKEDLLRSGLKELGRELHARQRAALAGQAGTRQRLAFSLAFFEHAYSHRETYQAIAGRRSGAIVLDGMRAMLAELVRGDFKAMPPGRRASDLPRDAVVEFVVGSLMSLLIWWLDRKAKLPPAEVDAIFRRMTLPALLDT
jgi:AcrR family transcriptional regulator